MAQALKVGRYLSANPSATIEDLARFVLTDDKLPTETVMNWVAFFIKPSTELVDVGDMCETLGLDSGASAHSLRVKRNLWMLNDDQVTVVSVDSKTTYRVAASAMCEVISKLSGAGEARRILALLQEARRAYRTRLEKAGEPQAKKIKTHHMPVAAPSRTTSTPARQPRPAAPVTPAPATVQHEGAPRRSTRRFVTFMYASPYLVMAPKGGLVQCSHADVEAEYEAVVKGLAVASYAEHGEQSYQRSTTAPVAVRPLVATRSNLQQVELEGCSVLHFAGHGIKEGALLFENNKMAGDLVHVQEVVKYFKTDKPRLVILLACHSETMAPAFLAAGVKHVVAISAKWAIDEDAVNVFAWTLHQSLASGRSVASSVSHAQASVRESDIKDADEEADNFVLLPRGADHSEVIFPSTFHDSDVVHGDPFPRLRRDELPKEVHEYKERQIEEGLVCGLFAAKKTSIVWLHGPQDAGKTQLACSAARALEFRRVFPRGITFIRVPPSSAACACAADTTLAALKLQVDTWLAATVDRGMLHEFNPATLVVLDGIDALVASPAFVSWLDELCFMKSFVHFLVTSRAVPTDINKLQNPNRVRAIYVSCHSSLESDTPLHRRFDPLDEYGDYNLAASVKDEDM